MKKFIKIIGILAGLGLLVVVLTVALMPWMDRWGATDEEIAASYTGDELVPSPRIGYTRAISINAPPEDVYPWVVQLGAEKGGMYSYEWFETNVLQCELINADRIHPEWQDLKVGDPMKMCPGTSGPPPYEIAIIKPNQSIIMGHKDNGNWVEIWQFLFVEQEDGSTRLVIRSRSAAQGWFWDLIRPGEFIMMRGMMLGIKERGENMEPYQAASETNTISMNEFGQTISLSYDPDLTSTVATGTVPAVPVSDQRMFAESHPAYAEFRFMDFMNGWNYDLPIYSENRVAQVMVFRTSDFPGYGDDSLQGFIKQSQALADLLKNGVDEAHCAQPLMDYESALPFLPWTNAKQSFCAQPKVIEFANGKGVRYLTHYAQDPSPALESQIFYTFQGITNDGQFYVAAFFPVQTGIFPSEPADCSACGDNPIPEWEATLLEQLKQLNAQTEDQFSPALTVLDEIIGSITITQ